MIRNSSQIPGEPSDPRGAAGALKNKNKEDVFQKLQDLRQSLARLNIRHKITNTDYKDLDKCIDSIAALIAELTDNMDSDSIHSATMTTVDKFVNQSYENHKKLVEISEFYEARINELRQEANLDWRTQLLNFQAFMERAKIALQLAVNGGVYAFGIIDIRDFKHYNDTYGHLIGDKMIATVADIIKDCIRTVPRSSDDDMGRDLKARIGGDEFAFMMLQFRDLGAVLSISERLRSAVSSYDWSGVHPDLRGDPVEIDIGIIGMIFRDKAHYDTVKLLEELYKEADRLMYNHKDFVKLIGETPAIPIVWWEINGGIKKNVTPDL